MFDAILANDVLEHLPDLVGAMTSCKKLLKTGGEMRIHVPYDLSYGAWQDPTHLRAFNEKSWAYYCEWHWYLGWEDRFYVTSLEFRLNPIAQDLKLTQEELLRTPRAVDSMFVVLTKGKK
jgi:SAM-dependent methyltransferase